MKKSTVKTPFQNLKFVIFLNKVLGLVSCKLVNGRFKRNSAWNNCYCTLWILFHFTYSGFYYYQHYSSLDKTADVYFVLSILRFTSYFLSLLPYHYVAVSRNQDFVKFSDKLETYDDVVTALGHQRKDNHIFTWLYFMYTLITLIMKTYYALKSGAEKGIAGILTMTFESVIPATVGTYCVFITGIYLDVIRQRFRHLNETVVPQVVELPVTGSPGEITIYDVRHLHGVLIDGAALINTLYGFATFLTFASILLEFISIVYLFIKNIETNNTVVTILDLFFQVIYLFAMYHFTALEANRVEDCLVQHGLSFQNARCRMDKIETMLYFYHNRFSFTAAEFFTLDLTILLSIASTVTTLITLIV